MGHCINYIVAEKNADKNEIIFAIEEEAEHANYGEGGYSGNLHMSSHWHSDTIYDSHDDAVEAISRLERGSYDDHAVLFRDTTNLENAKTKKIREQIAQVRQKQSEYIAANHVSSRKSAMIGCPHCGSKIARDYLRSDRCPVCGTDLRSETVLKRIDSYDAKIAELDKKLVDEKKKLAAKAPVKWLVKYEYHV